MVIEDSHWLLQPKVAGKLAAYPRILDDPELSLGKRLNGARRQVIQIPDRSSDKRKLAATGFRTHFLPGAGVVPVVGGVVGVDGLVAGAPAAGLDPPAAGAGEVGLADFAAFSASAFCLSVAAFCLAAFSAASWSASRACGC